MSQSKGTHVTDDYAIIDAASTTAIGDTFSNGNLHPAFLWQQLAEINKTLTTLAIGQVRIDERITRIQDNLIIKINAGAELAATNIDHLTKSIEKLDASLSGRIDNVDVRLSGKISDLDVRLSVKINDLDARLSEKINDLDVRLSEKVSDVDVRLSGRIDALDARLSGKIGALDARLSEKIDALDARLSGKIDALATDIKKIDKLVLYGKALFVTGVAVAGGLAWLIVHVDRITISIT